MVWLKNANVSHEFPSFITVQEKQSELKLENLELLDMNHLKELGTVIEEVFLLLLKNLLIQSSLM